MIRLVFLLGACALLILLSQGLRAVYFEAPELSYEGNEIVANTFAATSSSPIENVVEEDTTQEVGVVIEASTTSTKSVPLPPPTTKAAVITVPPLNDDSAHYASLNPEILNEKVRSTLVNILCEASEPLRSTSGSGVIVDQKGLILTNAHIAQYFLLEQSALPVSCTIRSGSPARAKWGAKLIYIPETWVQKHAKDILLSRAMGTGEDDFAILAITPSVEGEQLPASFPFIPIVDEGFATNENDPVLVAGYPAEFVGGSAARNSLYSSTVFSSIKQLLTFTEKVVDVISVKGTVLAQSGSSGGSFVDLYGKLVGLIVTTSIGLTTDTRDLHAITPGHMSRSMEEHESISLQEFMSQDRNFLLAQFDAKAYKLSQILLAAISSQRD